MIEERTAAAETNGHRVNPVGMDYLEGYMTWLTRGTAAARVADYIDQA